MLKALGVYMPLTTYIFIKPIRSNSTLRTKATLVGVERIKPGAGYTLRLDTIDETEDLVCQTFQFGIYRGVAVTGTETTTITAPELPPPQPLNKASTDIPVAAGTAHTYTECARIWNLSIPIDSLLRTQAFLTLFYMAPPPWPWRSAS